MLLSESRLTELTGYARPSFQIGWLRERGWPFEIGGDGRPKVLKSVAESRLGGKVSSEPEMVLPNEAA